MPAEKILTQNLGIASPKHDYSDYLHSSRSSSLTEKRAPLSGGGGGRIKAMVVSLENAASSIKPFSILPLENSEIESEESEEQEVEGGDKLQLVRITSRDTMMSMHEQLKARRAE